MRVIVLIICIIILSGCAKKKDNTYVGVEEKATTEKIRDISQKQTEKETENDYSISKEMVELYIDDSHFYDYDEGINFANENETEEKFHVKVLEAYTSDELKDFGEYFCTDKIKERIEEQREFCVSGKGYNDFDLTYMCVKIELTNISEEDMQLCVGNCLNVYTRIYDERGKEFNLADKYIDLPTAYNEFRYDSSKKVSEGNEYYFLSLSAGETITTNCVYIMRKDFLDDELYLGLHLDEGEYNRKYNCIFPPTAETTKFLKINLQDK